jgi:hypothetical protein
MCIAAMPMPRTRRRHCLPAGRPNTGHVASRRCTRWLHADHVRQLHVASRRPQSLQELRAAPHNAGIYPPSPLQSAASLRVCSSCGSAVRYRTRAFAEAADATGWGVLTNCLRPSSALRISFRVRMVTCPSDICAFWRAVLSTALSENWRDPACCGCAVQGCTTQQERGPTPPVRVTIRGGGVLAAWHEERARRRAPCG